MAEHHPRLRCWLDARASHAGASRAAGELPEALANFTTGLGEEGPPHVRPIREHRLEWAYETGAIDIVQEGIVNQTIRNSVEYE